jgi:hypothetical protein
LLNVVESNAPEIAGSDAPLPSKMPQDIRQGMSEKATPGLSSEHGEHWESAASQCPCEQILLVLADERESEWKGVKQEE